jgi:hypothetical protein
MTDDSTSETWGTWLKLHAVPGAAAFLLGALLYLGALGWRGVGAEGLSFVEHAQKLAQQFGSGLGSASLASTRPLSELGFALLWAYVPGSAIQAGSILSALAVAAALPAVWSMGRSLSGPTAGLIAAVIFGGLPIVAGTATSLGHGAWMLAAWCWCLRLGTLDRYQWWLVVPLAVVTGIALLVWPPIAAWLPFWLYLHLGARHIDRPSADADAGATAGCIDRPVVPLVVLLTIPLALGVATLLHPGLRAGPIEGWRTFATFNLSWAPESFLYAGGAYTESRPPPWAGVVLGWRALPLPVTGLALVGWVSHASRSEGVIDVDQRGRLVARTMVWGLPLACLIPWLTRSRTFGGAHFLLAAAPAVAILAGDVAGRIVDRVERGLHDVASPTFARASTAIAAVALAAWPLAETVRVHPFEGSYYSIASGGLSEAIDDGFPGSRDGVVPRSIASEVVASTPEGRLYVPEGRDAFGLYLRQQLLSGVDVLPSGYDAGGMLRRLEMASPPSKEDEEVGAFVRTDAPDVRTWRVDGLAIWWLERYTTSDSRSRSTSSSE